MLKITRLGLAAGLIIALGMGYNSNAQGLKTPAPSPTQTLKQNFALGEITIEYSRPSVKGRTIFGDLVPFGKVWRTGANGATKVTFTEDMKVEGKDLKAGTYALYTIPGKESWDVMFYKDLTMGGNVDDYKVENEVLKVNVKPMAVANKVETFTIDVAEVMPKTATIELVWDNTKVGIKVSADIDSKIMKNIETTMAKDARPYGQAAGYYYDNDKDMNQALTWVNKALEQNPKAYWNMMLKANIEYKLKNYTAATASAEKTIAMATEDKDDSYVNKAKKLLADTKAAKK